jgi:accessory gene regulator protein AgrB
MLYYLFCNLIYVVSRILELSTVLTCNVLSIFLFVLGAFVSFRFYYGLQALWILLTRPPFLSIEI